MNLHASAVSIRNRGVLVVGPSGSGKTRLALALVREAKLFGHEGALVCDDQALLEARDGRLIARVPATISGLVEIRGFGILSVPFAVQCAIDLVVDLVPTDGAPRMVEGEFRELAGCRIPGLRLPERDAAGAVAVVNAFLFGSPF